MYYLISKDRPVKSILCEEEHISIFIDDRERYVYEVALPSSHHI